MLGGVVAVGLIGQSRGASLGGAIAVRLETAPATRIGDATARLTRAAPAPTATPYAQRPPRWITGSPPTGHPLPVRTKRLLGLNWQVDPYQT